MGGRSLNSHKTSRGSATATSALACAIAAMLVVACGKSSRHSKPTPAVTAVEEPQRSVDAPAPIVEPPVPVPEAPPDPCRQPRPLPDNVIDDFEDGDAALSIVSGRNGSWFVATDRTPAARTTPAEGPGNPTRLDPARCDSLFGLHFEGAGFVQWGTVVAATLRYDQRAQPVDFSAFQGVRFWVRVGPKHQGVVRFNVDDVTTHADAGRCRTNDSGAHACWNSFGIDMPLLSADWQEKRVDFASLRQRVSASPPAALDAAHVYRLSFKTSPGNAFDVWIDDLSLF